MRTISLCLVATILAACKPTPPPAPPTSPQPAASASRVATSRQVRGQVFVTMNNGQATKLAGVEIVAIKPAAAREHMEFARTRSAELLAGTNRRLKEEQAKVNGLELETTRAKAAVANGYVNTANLPARVRAAAVGPLEDRMIDAQKTELEARKAFATFLSEAKSEQRANAPSRLAWQRPWPGVIASTVTDADGNYELALPDSEVVLAATAGRKLQRVEEDYFWLITVPTNQSGALHLSNVNMLGE